MKTIFLPIETISEANARGHFMAKARRAKKQRNAAKLITSARLNGPLLNIELRRLHLPRRRIRDEADNLPAACKSVKDGICDALAIDDRSKAIQWAYSQKSVGCDSLVGVDVIFGRPGE